MPRVPRVKKTLNSDEELKVALPPLGKIPCALCLRSYGDIDFWCQIPARGRSKCLRASAMHRDYRVLPAFDEVLAVVGLRSAIWGLEEVGKSSSKLRVELREALALARALPAMKELEKEVRAGSKPKPAEAGEGGPRPGPRTHSQMVAVEISIPRPSTTRSTAARAG